MKVGRDGVDKVPVGVDEGRVGVDEGRPCDAGGRKKGNLRQFFSYNRLL